LKLNHYFNDVNNRIVKILGFTKDPKLDDYILVMQYASGGDLYKYLQKKFTVIDWQRKIIILNYISIGYLYLNILIVIN
jgi:hypothetical protein